MSSKMTFDELAAIIASTSAPSTKPTAPSTGASDRKLPPRDFAGLVRLTGRVRFLLGGIEMTPSEDGKIVASKVVIDGHVASIEVKKGKEEETGYHGYGSIEVPREWVEKIIKGKFGRFTGRAYAYGTETKVSAAKGGTYSRFLLSKIVNLDEFKVVESKTSMPTDAELKALGVTKARAKEISSEIAASHAWPKSVDWKSAEEGRRVAAAVRRAGGLKH